MYILYNYVYIYIYIYIYTIFLLLNAPVSIFSQRPILFTRRLLEIGANWRQAFILTCTNFAHSISAHGESWQKTSRAPDTEAKAVGSHYMH